MDDRQAEYIDVAIASGLSIPDTLASLPEGRQNEPQQPVSLLAAWAFIISVFALVALLWLFR